MTRPQAEPTTIVVYTDIACPWSTVAIAQLLRARTVLGRSAAVTAPNRVPNGRTSRNANMICIPFCVIRNSPSRSVKFRSHRCFSDSRARVSINVA